MQKVLDRLMLSELSEANDPFYLQRNGVQAILYFGKGGMFTDTIKLYNRPTLKDGTLAPEMLRDGIEFLRESLRAGRRVLAVGPTGATIAAAYLAEMGMSSDQALEMLGGERNPQPDVESLFSHASELRRRSEISVHGSRD
ncbi:hypothetical protein BH09SUM1_BH09SUM1_14110 [soil metagenome]